MNTTTINPADEAERIVDAALEDFDADRKGRERAMFELLTSNDLIPELDEFEVDERESEILDAMRDGVRQAIEDGYTDDIDGGLIQFGIGAAIDYMEATAPTIEQVTAHVRDRRDSRTAFRVTGTSDGITVQFAERASDYELDSRGNEVPMRSLLDNSMDDYLAEVIDDSSSQTVEVEISRYASTDAVEDAITKSLAELRALVDAEVAGNDAEDRAELEKLVSEVVDEVRRNPDARDDYPDSDYDSTYRDSIWIEDGAVHGKVIGRQREGFPNVIFVSRDI